MFTLDHDMCKVQLGICEEGFVEILLSNFLKCCIDSGGDVAVSVSPLHSRNRGQRSRLATEQSPRLIGIQCTSAE